MPDVNERDVIDAVATTLASQDLSQNAVAMIQRSAEKVLQRTQQDVSANLNEDAERITLEFCKKLADKLGKLSQVWCNSATQELMVYPEGTRFIHREQKSTAIVIEQAPHVRTLSVQKNSGIHTVRLSMPYVLFFIGFQDNVWTGKLQIATAKKPIASLNEQLNVIQLPNLMTTHNVCMGQFSSDRNKTLTEQVNAIIGNYWQSVFTPGTGFSYTADGSVSQNNYNTHLNQINEWEKLTKQDPLAVLKRKECAGSTVTELLKACMGDYGVRESNLDIVQSLKKEIITTVGEIGASVQKTLLNINCVKQNKQKVSIETLDEILKKIITQAYKELWKYLEVKMQREREKVQAEMLEMLRARTSIPVEKPKKYKSKYESYGYDYD